MKNILILQIKQNPRIYISNIKFYLTMKNNIYSVYEINYI